MRRLLWMYGNVLEVWAHWVIGLECRLGAYNTPSYHFRCGNSSGKSDSKPSAESDQK